MQLIPITHCNNVTNNRSTVEVIKKIFRCRNHTFWTLVNSLNSLIVVWVSGSEQITQFRGWMSKQGHLNTSRKIKIKFSLTSLAWRKSSSKTVPVIIRGRKLPVNHPQPSPLVTHQPSPPPPPPRTVGGQLSPLPQLTNRPDLN